MNKENTVIVMHGSFDLLSLVTVIDSNGIQILKKEVLNVPVDIADAAIYLAETCDAGRIKIHAKDAFYSEIERLIRQENTDIEIGRI